MVASLESLIRKSINPFDPTTFKPGNFWRDKQDQSEDVESIHAHVVDSVEQILMDVLRDHRTRTLMLLGDSGAGKSHLLGRIKRRLNDKACFAYVGPWPDNQFIWRHVLRQTVDSLMEVPEGKTESQLLRWLKGLDIFKHESLTQRLLGKRSVFVRDMKASFPITYQGKEFFGVLYALLDPDLQMLATDWLRGEDLDDDDLKLLRVRHSIDSEDAAQKIMSNLGWLANSTQPIVICFDNLDNIPAMPNGQTGLRAMFNVNTTIHNEGLKNFVVLISLITSNWRKNGKEVEHADRARVDQTLTLRSISLDQAASLWAYRLRSIHRQASPSPSSPIAPLTQDWLAYKHPGGKVVPRSALMLAEQLIREYKRTGKLPDIPDQEAGTRAEITPGKPSPSSQSVAPPPPKNNDRASFELTWQKEFKETRNHLRRISQFSSPELIRRLQEALEALAISQVRHGVLPSNKYRSYSLGHRQFGATGIIWTEDGNLTSFCHVMRACKKMIQSQVCDHIYLIRKERLGTSKNKGYQLFDEIFSNSQHTHLKPDLESVQYLETYHRLVNAAAGGELVIGSKTPNVKELQALVQDSGVLSTCSLLQQLSIVERKDGVVVMPSTSASLPVKVVKEKRVFKSSGPSQQDVVAAERYILNLMTTQSLMGMQILIETTQEQVPALGSDDVIGLIQGLCQSKRVQMLDPNAKPENQLLCYVPQ